MLANVLFIMLFCGFLEICSRFEVQLKHETCSATYNQMQLKFIKKM